jgi:hypothetical protein
MNNLSRGERLQIMLSPEELSAVDDFRFKQRMPSRAAAVRELFRLGLTNAGLTLAKREKVVRLRCAGGRHQRPQKARNTRKQHN